MNPPSSWSEDEFKKLSRRNQRRVAALFDVRQTCLWEFTDRHQWEAAGQAAQEVDP